MSKFPAAPPPPENGSAAASRNFCGAPARQPETTPASRKTDGGAAEGSISIYQSLFIVVFISDCVSISHC